MRGLVWVKAAYRSQSMRMRAKKSRVGEGVSGPSEWRNRGRGRVGGAATMERRAVEGELSRFWEAKKPHLINEMITFLIQMT